MSFKASKRGNSWLQEMAIRLMFSHGNLHPKDIVKLLTDKHREKQEDISKVIDDFLTVNLFRYKADGTLTFHSKIVKDFLRKDLSM